MKRVFTFTEASSMRPYTQLIHSNGWFHVLGGFLSELKDAGIWLRMRARDEASGRLNTRIVSWNVELPNFWSSVFGFFFLSLVSFPFFHSHYRHFCITFHEFLFIGYNALFCNAGLRVQSLRMGHGTKEIRNSQWFALAEFRKRSEMNTAKGEISVVNLMLN